MASEELFNWCCRQNCKGDFNCDLCMYNKGRADCLDKLKEYVESRLDMRFALDILCKEVIDEFIAEQLKEQSKCQNVKLK